MTDFTKVLTDAEGNNIKDVVAMEGSGGKEVFLTLGLATSHALFANYPDEQNLGGEEKFKRAELAMRLRDAKNGTVTVEEISLIKKMIAKFYSPVVVYRAWLLLDPALKKDKE